MSEACFGSNKGSSFYLLFRYRGRQTQKVHQQNQLLQPKLLQLNQPQHLKLHLPNHPRLHLPSPHQRPNLHPLNRRLLLKVQLQALSLNLPPADPSRPVKRPPTGGAQEAKRKLLLKLPHEFHQDWLQSKVRSPSRLPPLLQTLQRPLRLLEPEGRQAAVHLQEGVQVNAPPWPRQTKR